MSQLYRKSYCKCFRTTLNTNHYYSVAWNSISLVITIFWTTAWLYPKSWIAASLWRKKKEEKRKEKRKKRRKKSTRACLRECFTSFVFRSTERGRLLFSSADASLIIPWVKNTVCFLCAESFICLMQSFMLLLNEIFYKAEFNIIKSVLETYLSTHPLGVNKGGKSNWFSLCWL